MSLREAARTTAAGDFQLTAAGRGSLRAHGPLTFASARRACALGVQALAQAVDGRLEIDCGGVTVSDSAGLAVLIEWLAVARRTRRSLRYTLLPEGLGALAKISDVRELLESGV